MSEPLGLVREDEASLCGEFLGEHATPSLVLRTYLGNLLYTTPGLALEVPPPVLGQLDLCDVTEKDFGPTPLRLLCTPSAASPKPVLMYSGRSSANGVNPCTAKGVLVDSNAGRKLVTVPSFAARLLIDEPPVVVALADEVPFGTGKKRTAKATERTLAMFKELRAMQSVDWSRSFLFGVAVKGHSPADTATAASKLLELGAMGISIGSANTGESPLELQAVMMAVRAAVGPKIPLLQQGADSIKQILRAVAEGADLVSSNLPSLLTDACLALHFDLNDLRSTSSSSSSSNSSSSSSSSSGDGGGVGIEPVAKKPKVEEVAASEGTETEAHEASVVVMQQDQKEDEEAEGKASKPLKPVVDATMLAPSLDLRDKAFQLDARPLQEGCTCHACRNHTRAYIHHLILAHELLSEVLLYAHNQHQMLLLFVEIRRQIKLGTFYQWAEEAMR